MNILSITGILPIKDIEKSNDFLIPLFTTYKKKFPNDNVYFVRLEKMRPFSKIKKLLRGIKTYEIGGFTIHLMRYFSTWRYTGLHCFLSSYSAYFLNKKELLQLITQHKIDIIHAEYIIPDGYLAYLISKKCKIPYIVTTHYEFRYFSSFFSRKAVVKVLKNAAFLTPLNYISSDLYKKYNIEKSVIIPHGIDSSFLCARHIPHDKEVVRIVSIASLLKMKNLDMVLRALANLKDKFYFHYTIIGSGPEKDSLMALARSLGIENHVDFAGTIPYSEIPVILERNDVFILTSYFETFGRVLFEAMAVGLAVICSKNTGIHGYFTEGEEGLSVHHTNVADIEAKLSLLLCDENIRLEMGRKAKQLMLNFTWENIVITLQDLYKKAHLSANTSTPISI